MKKICTIFMLFALGFAAYAQTRTSQNSINFYLLQAQNWVGNVLNVKVVSAEPTDDYVGNYTICFYCETETSDGREGGNIRVLVPMWKAKEFYAKYADAEDRGGETLSARLVIYNWPLGHSKYVLNVE